MKHKLFFALTIAMLSMGVASAQSTTFLHNDFKLNHVVGMFQGSSNNTYFEYLTLGRPSYTSHRSEWAYAPHAQGFALETMNRKDPAREMNEDQKSRAIEHILDLADLEIDATSIIEKPYLDSKWTKWESKYNVLMTMQLTREEREYWQSKEQQFELQMRVMTGATIPNAERAKVAADLESELEEATEEAATFYSVLCARHIQQTHPLYNTDAPKPINRRRVKAIAEEKLANWNLAAYDIGTRYGTSTEPVNERWTKGWSTIDATTTNN